MGYYEDLGVDKDTPIEEIKKAYKTKSRKTHPDLGGNRDEFDKVKTAYEVLSVPIKKTRYDKGEEPDLPPIDELARTQLMQMFLSLVGGCDVKHMDIVTDMKDNIQRSKMNLSNAKKQSMDKKEMWDEVKSRLKHDGSSPDFLRFVVEKEIDKIAMFDVEYKRTVLVLEMMDDMVDTYQYDFDEREHDNNSRVWNYFNVY